MKTKCYIFLFITCILFSCSPVNNEEAKEDIKVVERKPMYDGSRTVKVFNYEYKGHLYQFHFIGEGKVRTGGPIHDPNCKCFKDSVQ